MGPQPLKTVLEEELSQIETARTLRLPGSDRPAAKDSLVGLAFSGGGIRSATFNLGVLQALAQARLLRCVDYVSTVSGGGYIGGWLMAWMRHQQIGVHQIEGKLSSPSDPRSNAADQPEVHFLRSFSNYLTPRRGLLSADFWAFVASYLRNMLLNQLILVLSLLALLLAPRMIVWVLHSFENIEESLRGRYSDLFQQFAEAQYFALALGLLLGLIGILFMGTNMVSVDEQEAGVQPEQRWAWIAHPGCVQGLIVVPLFLSAALVSYGLGQLLQQLHLLEHPVSRMPLLGFFFYFGLWAFALSIREGTHWLNRARQAGTSAPQRGPRTWHVLWTAAVAGAIAGYLFLPSARILIPEGKELGVTASKWQILTFGTPALVGVMLLAGVLHIGLMGRGMSDAHREWWARLGGWLVIYSVGWLALFVIAIYVPKWLGDLWLWECARKHHVFTFGGLVTWISTTTYGVLFGKSASTQKPLEDAALRKRALGLIALRFARSATAAGVAYVDALICFAYTLAVFSPRATQDKKQSMAPIKSPCCCLTDPKHCQATAESPSSRSDFWYAA